MRLGVGALLLPSMLRLRRFGLGRLRFGFGAAPFVRLRLEPCVFRLGAFLSRLDDRQFLDQPIDLFFEGANATRAEAPELDKPGVDVVFIESRDADIETSSCVLRSEYCLGQLRRS